MTTRRRVRRRKTRPAQPSPKTRKRVRRRKVAKVRRRIRRRKVLSNSALVSLVELLIDKAPRRRRAGTRRRKPRESVPRTAANTQQIDVQNSGYSAAIAKEAAAVQFAQSAQALKEHETEVALQKAELARLMIMNGHGETAREIVAYHKSQGVTVTHEQALNIVREIDKGRKDIAALKSDKIRLEEEAAAAQIEHERVLKLHAEEQEEMGLISASLDNDARESEARFHDAEAKRSTAEAAAATSEDARVAAERAAEASKLVAAQLRQDQFVSATNQANEIARKKWSDKIKFDDLRAFVRVYNAKNPYNRVSVKGSKLELLSVAEGLDGFSAAFGSPEAIPQQQLSDESKPSTSASAPTSSIPDTASDPPGKGAASDTNEGFDMSLAFGLGKDAPQRGLSDRDINHIMKKHTRFVGVFSADEMDDIPTNKSAFGLVINTQPRTVSHGHWVACYVDTNRDKAIEYFDPFGEDPTDRFMKDLKDLVDGLNARDYLKLKINRIKVQDIRTDTCGWHAMNFLIRRFAGQPFREVSGFDDSRRGEKDASVLKKKYENYGYI